MELEDGDKLFKDELYAQRFLEKLIWNGSKRRCPFCATIAPYLLANGRWRCRSCRRDFRSWTGRWLGLVRVTAMEWCRLIKLFESEVVPFKATGHLEISYPTALKAFHVIRRSILHNFESEGIRQCSSDECGQQEFAAFAKERLLKHHGISKKHFSLYFSEAAFRFWHRGKDLFPIIAACLAQPVAEIL